MKFLSDIVNIIFGDLSPLTSVECGFGKKSFVCTGVRKPGIHRCVCDCHDVTSGVYKTKQTSVTKASP